MPAPADLDRANPLARFRDEFHLPPGKIYLDGNSLGPLSRRAEASLLRVLEEWRRLAIAGWLEASPPWLTLADTAAERLSPLVGARAGSICITGQTTANLHQLLATLFDPSHPTRRVIVGDTLNFSSDTYALQSHLRLRGLNAAQHLRLIPSRDGQILRIDDILASFTRDVQMVVLPAVIFTSGQLLDVATITRKAHERGILIGWDLSHSIGAVPHALDRDGIDFAFWCNYKWLGAGPGAVGGLYLNPKYHERVPGLAGWWGVRPGRRFMMSRDHDPAPGSAALQIGTPHILSLAPLLGALELIADAGGIEALRAQSLALTDYLFEAVDSNLRALGFSIATPQGRLVRGGHIALVHAHAWRICQALAAANVVGDFRQPDIIRLAPSPLYTTFAECAEAVARLSEIVTTRAHEKFPDAPTLVP